MKVEARYGAVGGIFPGATRFYVTHGSSSVRYGDTYSYNTVESSWFKGTCTDCYVVECY